MLLYRFGACIQLHGHSATIQSPLKELQKNKTDSLFDIEIMTPKGAEKAPLCCCVRWCGKKPFHCKKKQKKKTCTTQSGMCGMNLISQNVIVKMLKTSGEMKS